MRSLAGAAGAWFRRHPALALLLCVAYIFAAALIAEGHPTREVLLFIPVVIVFART